MMTLVFLVALRTGGEQTIPRESKLRTGRGDAYKKRNAHWRTGYLHYAIKSLYQSSGLECIWKSCSSCAAESKEMPVILFLSSVCQEIVFNLSELGMTIFYWVSMDSKFYVCLVSYIFQKMLPCVALWRIQRLKATQPKISSYRYNAWGFFFALLLQNILYI